MRTASLAEIADIVSGATPKTGVESYWGGDVLWATPADLSKLRGAYISGTPRTLTASGLASCGATVLPVGSVLLSSRAPIGHVAINSKPIATNQGFKSLVPRADRLDAKYLYHWLRSQTAHLQNLGNGATFKELSKSTVSRIEVPLPEVVEQRRIAAILDQADALRVRRQQVLDHLHALEQSTFHDTFARTSWPIEPLSSLATTSSGGTPDRSNRANYGGGIPWVKSGELHAGTVTATEESLTESGLASSSAKLLTAGTVLIAMYGATAGVVARLGIEAATNQAVCAVTPGPLIDADYLIARLRSMEAALLSRRSGGAQPNLSQGLIRALEIPVPDLDLQRKFAELLKSVDRQRAAVLRALTTDDELFASLQHRAFRGEL